MLPGSADSETFIAQVAEQKTQLLESVDQHGALLFKHTPISSAESFEALVQVLTPHLLTYTGGGSPRTKVSGSVYTSTEYVSRVHIPLHCEMSYTDSVPRYIWFYCAQKAESGGMTPIGYLQTIEQNLPETLVDRFREKGVRYTTFMNNGRGFGKSWQKTYETDSRDEVSALLDRSSDVEYEWRNDGLFVSRTHPSHFRHSVSGELLWYNQAVNWHPSHLGIDNYLKLEKVFGSPDCFPKMAFYGDGTMIAHEDILAIDAACTRSECRFDWDNGDIMLLDNQRVAHARHSFEGERTVLVAMAS